MSWSYTAIKKLYILFIIFSTLVCTCFSRWFSAISFAGSLVGKDVQMFVYRSPIMVVVHVHATMKE